MSAKFTEGIKEQDNFISVPGTGKSHVSDCLMQTHRDSTLSSLTSTHIWINQVQPTEELDNTSSMCEHTPPQRGGRFLCICMN